MEKQLIPQLRFPYYDDNWNKVVLENITTKISDGIHSTPNYDLNGDYYFVNGNNLIDGVISINENTKKVTLEEFIKHKRPLSKNSILLSINGTIGNLALYNNENIVLGKSACYINLKKGLPVDFYYYILQTPRIKKYFLSELTGSTIMNLSLKTVKGTKLIVPTFPEQQKIASFLSDVDDKIAKLTKKKDLLEQYKKGIMQKIFSQELRFKDDNGNEFPNWEEKKLGSICNYKNGGSFEQYVSNEGVYNLISLNSLDINGKLKPSHKKVTINDNSLDKGDLVMVLSDVAHGYFLGLTDIVPDNTFVLNQRMGALKPKININSYFLKTYINFNQKYFKLMGQGSSQQNLSKGDILKFTVKTPIIEEQIKIANFLSDIDIKIEVLNTKIENSKAFKKGLLQQMFV